MAMTFEEKYERARPSFIKVNEKRFADLEAGTTVLIPSPQDIEREIELLAVDELIDQPELRRRLADRHEAQGTCPVMTGMHLRIVAELALGELDAGVPAGDVPPVWQVISPDSPLASKLPGGPVRIAQLRDPQV